MKQLPFEIYHVLVYPYWVVLAQLPLTVSKTWCLTFTSRTQGNFISMYVKVSVSLPANVHNSLGFGGVCCGYFTEASENLPPTNYFSSNISFLSPLVRPNGKTERALTSQWGPAVIWFAKILGIVTKHAQKSCSLICSFTWILCFQIELWISVSGKPTLFQVSNFSHFCCSFQKVNFNFFSSLGKVCIFSLTQE